MALPRLGSHLADPRKPIIKKRPPRIRKRPKSGRKREDAQCVHRSIHIVVNAGGCKCGGITQSWIDCLVCRRSSGVRCVDAAKEGVTARLCSATVRQTRGPVRTLMAVPSELDTAGASYPGRQAARIGRH